MGRTANDDRSDSLNPKSDAYQSGADNRADQLNPNNERFQGSNEEKNAEQPDGSNQDD